MPGLTEAQVQRSVRVGNSVGLGPDELKESGLFAKDLHDGFFSEPLPQEMPPKFKYVGLISSEFLAAFRDLDSFVCPSQKCQELMVEVCESSRGIKVILTNRSNSKAYVPRGVVTFYVGYVELMDIGRDAFQYFWPLEYPVESLGEVVLPGTSLVICTGIICTKNMRVLPTRDAFIKCLKLNFNTEEGEELLIRVKNRSTIPVVTTPGDYEAFDLGDSWWEK